MWSEHFSTDVSYKGASLSSVACLLNRENQFAWENNSVYEQINAIQWFYSASTDYDRA